MAEISQDNVESNLSGSFRHMVLTIYYHIIHEDVRISDFLNPFTFFWLMFAPMEMLLQWLMQERLIAKDVKCTECSRLCTLSKRKSSIDGYSYILVK